ncbi:transposase [Companilactobacillus zhachilii]|uniref:transposase n=1 Tax=Companilactobacillus zhachilii TaxID=2304606 RepID=UPI0019248016|nr:transposase [Companilactobacillus zhachilii]MBL3530451.1 transposase [Companilactobacillus zhachilii]
MQMKYSSNQPILKLYVSWKPKSNNVVLAINAIVDDIPDESINIAYARTGRPAYPAKMILKMLLFGYSKQIFSGRKIFDLVDDNLSMRWLIGNVNSVPSYRTINRFRSNKHFSVLLELLFKAFRDYLRMIGLFDDSQMFVDGTKLLANANKYTFVWKKSVEKAEKSLDSNIQTLYENLVQSDIKVPESSLCQRPLTGDGLTKVSEVLKAKINELSSLITKEKVLPGDLRIRGSDEIINIFYIY